PSRTLGRWQIVVGGQATETQVAYLTTAQARTLAMSTKGPDSALSSDVHVDMDMLTLSDAIAEGILPWTLGAAQKRIQRRVGKVPTPRGKRGNADLYARQDLAEWVASSR